MIKPEQIIDHVCKVLELDKNLLIAEERTTCPHCECKMRAKVNSTPKYVDARQIICYLIRFHSPYDSSEWYKGEYSYKAIAKALGRTLANGKGDHAFAMYSESNCRDLLSSKDKVFTEKFLKCELPKNKKVA
ncbi:MAG: hypothetical protein V4608_11070 [Bacteroidota bacterium]